jgi:membrane-associated protease RseP (regulator of RpoE activity)
VARSTLALAPSLPKTGPTGTRVLNVSLELDLTNCLPLNAKLFLRQLSHGQITMELDTSVVVFATSYVVIITVAGILVHELGHLLAARVLSIRVTGLTVGFGPELIGFTDQYGTRWKFAPLLIGGSCHFSDQTSNDAKGSETNNKHLHSLSEASPLERAVVYAAGPGFNLAFAALIWVAMAYHRVLLPFISDDEAVFGLPMFLAMFSISLAFFNLIPILPLDGGQLVLIGLEKLRGSTIANEQQLIRAGSWITAVLTIVIFFSICLAKNSSLWNF